MGDLTRCNLLHIVFSVMYTGEARGGGGAGGGKEVGMGRQGGKGKTGRGQRLVGCCCLRHLVSVNIFSVMYDHTFSQLAPHRWIEEKGDTKLIIIFLFTCATPGTTASGHIKQNINKL